MSSNARKTANFPDAENKLQAATKKSLFERQRAEAEAKRLKEEAETKAVYEDFVKSFDDEDDAPAGSGFERPGRYGGPPPPQRRQFAGGVGMGVPSGPSPGRGYGGGGGQSGRSSGPGSLGPPPSSLNKKRTFDGFQQHQRRDDRSLLAFDDHEAARETKRVFQTSDDEDEDTGRAMDRGEEKAVAKPTLRLASLPPGTSPAVIKALIPATLTVDSVHFLPPSGPGPMSEKKSTSAIVTLAKDTPANDIDTTVNQLQNRYLGFGYYLTLHRHLSSAAISSNSLPTTTGGGNQTSHPFGAKPVSVAPPAGRGAPPPPHHNSRFAPPTSYGPPIPNLSNGPLLHVPVQPPSSIKTLKAIHKTIESLLTHGPEFEALLMTRPTVQKSEHWAWLWDARSAGGVYYRWRLWSILTSSKAKGRYIPLFEGSSAWKAPEKETLPWEYTTQLSEFVEDSEYNSSEEDDSDNEASRRPPPVVAVGDGSEEGNAYLTPLAKAKLTHLLARLPDSTSLLRKGDVARITAFAISHAGRGAEEVVNMLVANIIHPYAFTSANPSYRDRNKVKTTTDGDGDEEAEKEEENRDHSSAQLIALYLISDILSSSSTSGVRHAWRYRSTFETALKNFNVFASLGRLERKLKWGRLRAEKWKRSVGNLLGLWEGWCVFSQDAQEGFRKEFENPPLTEDEKKEEEMRDAEKEANKVKNKWKAVDEASANAAVTTTAAADNDEDDEDVDGVPMEEDDEDIDGVPMIDEDIDGVPMVDEDEPHLDGDPMEEDTDIPAPRDESPPRPPPPAKQGLPSVEAMKKRVAEALERKSGGATSNGSSKDSNKEPPPPPILAGQAGTTTTATVKRQQRPTAADMFADSDDE